MSYNGNSAIRSHTYQNYAGIEPVNTGPRTSLCENMCTTRLGVNLFNQVNKHLFLMKPQTICRLVTAPKVCKGETPLHQK